MPEDCSNQQNHCSTYCGKHNVDLHWCWPMAMCGADLLRISAVAVRTASMPHLAKEHPPLRLFWVIETSFQRNISKALEGTSSKTIEFLWVFCIKYWRHIQNPNHHPSMPEFIPGLVHQLLNTYWLIANLHIYGCCSHSCLLLKEFSQPMYFQFVNLFSSKVILKLQGIFGTGPCFCVRSSLQVDYPWSN